MRPTDSKLAHVGRSYSPWTKGLGLCLLVIWIALSINTLNRADWLLENVLVFIAVPLLVWYGPGLRFTNSTYTCLFIFFALHLVGAHYTYSEVPYDRWFGIQIDRNHFDRLVHFLYGLLMAKPTIDLFAARAVPLGMWRWLMPIVFLCAHGALYEIVEWQAAEIFGGELGEAYLGLQGDSWDSQKDMALALLGAVIGVSAWRSCRACD
jgi:putative membrane protein